MKENNIQNNKEVKQNVILKFLKNPLVAAIIIAVIVLAVILIFYYLDVSSSRIYIDQAAISAPVITLGPATPGVLDKLFVKEGDKVYGDMLVAQVNGQAIYAKTEGIVISVQNTPGQIVSSQDGIVKMINPQEFRVIGHLSENKGLSQVKVGQQAIFEVDAYGSKKYDGIVDSISSTARTGDIVFSISDKRAEQQFDVKIKFNVDQYPELKNGMSARIWIYK